MAYVDPYEQGARPRPSFGGTATPRQPKTVMDNTVDPENGFHVNTPEWVNAVNTQHPEWGASGQPYAPAAPKYNFDWLNAGYDRTKLNDQNHNTAKYQIGRTLSQFDPHGGVNDAVLKALNALGFGTFAGSGDRLGIRGVTDAGRAAGLDPYDFEGDFVQGFHSATPQWGYDAYQAPTPQQAAYGPDPSAGAMPFSYAPTLFPQPSYQPPPQSNIPPIFQDPAFWQQLMGAMQPQYAPGYSNAPTPNFSGAQYGTSHAPVMQQNPQIQQLLSQLFAGLTGAH